MRRADYSCTDLNPATVPFVQGKSHTIIYVYVIYIYIYVINYIRYT